LRSFLFLYYFNFCSFLSEEEYEGGEEEIEMEEVGAEHDQEHGDEILKTTELAQDEDAGMNIGKGNLDLWSVV
jgi:hypothetical protein